MIDRCSHCGDVAEVETWGNSKFCKRCAKMYRDHYPKKPPEEMDIKIEEPKLGGNAAYNPSTGEMEILESTEDAKMFCMWISHEYMHHLLHDLVDLRCCYQYDAVSCRGEIHKELFAVGGKQ